MFTSSFLRSLRGKALRRKLWYKVLDRFDRSFYSLTCTVVAQVESLDLGREILGLVLKLKNALKGEFVRFVESFGVKQAWSSAYHAVLWGYEAARGWKYDPSLARLHALNQFNMPSGWGTA